MVARGAGDVGCAHCTTFGANQTCPVCGLQVCDKCAADWTTCNEPAGRELRLGMGWRLREVDPRGRLALVTHMIRTPRIVDLHGLRWMGIAPIGLNMYNALHASPPRMTSDGLLVHAEMVLFEDMTKPDGIRWHTLEGERISIHVNNVEGPYGPTVVSAVGDLFAYVTGTQHVVVTRHGPRIDPPAAAAAVAPPDAWRKQTDTSPLRFITQTCEPLPRKVISAIALDGERDLLAAATWREIAIQHVHDGKADHVAYIDTGVDANLTFLALTGRWLVYGTSHRLEVRRVGDRTAIDEAVAYRHEHTNAIAISRDGQYLAMAVGSKLVVHDLDRNRVQTFDEHSDGINYVRFSGDDHTLISGDNDNRVVMRPRTSEGYVHPIVKVSLHGTP